MTDEKMARQLASFLSEEVSPSVAFKLAQARQQAVSSVLVQGNTLTARAAFMDLRKWAVIGIILAASLFYAQSLSTVPPEDSELEEEVGILTGDLPLEVYHDRGFLEYLQQGGTASSE